MSTMRHGECFQLFNGAGECVGFLHIDEIQFACEQPDGGDALIDLRPRRLRVSAEAAEELLNAWEKVPPQPWCEVEVAEVRKVSSTAKVFQDAVS